MERDVRRGEGGLCAVVWGCRRSLRAVRSMAVVMMVVVDIAVEIWNSAFLFKAGCCSRLGWFRTTLGTHTPETPNAPRYSLFCGHRMY